MKIINKIFRYSHSSVFAIVGLIISFLTFSYYNGINAGNNLEELDKERFSYINEVYITAYGNDFLSQLMAMEKQENVIISLTGLPVYINQLGYCATGDVVISGDELVYPLVTGRYPARAELESGERVVVIGQGLKRYTKNYDGNDYITICGDDYHVTGYLGSSNSVVFDYFVVNYANCLGQGLYDDMMDYSLAIGSNIMLQSNHVSKEQILNSFVSFANTDEYYFEEQQTSPKFFGSRGLDEEDKQYAILSYLFSIIIIILVIEYWLICRQKEYAIRKAFGYSSDRLALKVIGELCIYMLIAILFSEILLAWFKVLDDRAVIFSMKDFANRLLALFQYAGITITILIISPLYRIYKNDPIQLLVYKERI